MLSMVLSWSVGIGVVVAQAAADPVVTKEQIARAIEELAAPTFDTRQAATDLLWKAGAAAEQALSEAAKSTDPEVRTRAAALLTKLRLGLRPDTPPEVAALIDQFRYAETTSLRRQALSELQAKGHWQAILTLIRAQQDAQERRMLATVVAGEAGKIVGPLVERGELAQAHQVLELVSISEAGVAQLTVFLALTGGLDRQIDATKARLDAQPREEDWTRLAYLVRANGNLPAAIDAANNTSDLFLRANLLAEAKRFSDAAAIASELFRKSPTRLETAAFAATFYRLAGNDAEHQRTIEALLKAANIDRLKDLPQPPRLADPFGAPASNVGLGYAWTAAETLLVNERLDDALPILRKINPRFAHAIYWRQHRHREALEFVGVTADKRLDRAWFDELPAPPGDAGMQEARFMLSARLARQLRELGRKEQVDQLVETLRGVAATSDQGRRLTTLATLAWQLGKHDDVAAYATDAIAAGAQPAMVLAALLKQQGPLATWWYEQWTNDAPLADRPKAMDRAIWLVVAQPPRGRLPENWRQLVSTEHAAGQQLAARPKAQRLVMLGQTCQVRGDRELARQYFAEAAEADPATAIRAADLALADSDWKSAEQLYERATKAAGGDAIATYLHGYCLTKAGNAEAGAKQLQAGSLMALAPEVRLALAMGLNERGLYDAALTQFELVRRTALPDSPQATTAAQFVGNLLNRQKSLVAADAWEQLRLHVLNANSNFTEVEAYLSLSHFIHRCRAKAAHETRDATTAAAELEACDKVLPADLRLLVEAIPSFTKAGMSAVADPLFDRGFATLHRVCQEFPTSATYLNNAAWLCARSQRKLDEALAFVEKAIELAPEEGAYYDTLAEVQFQRGDRAAAVAAANKALDIAQESKFSAQRLKHFQDDELKTLDRIESEP